MNLLYESPSWILASLIVVIPVMAISIFLLWLLRKYVSIETLRKSHDVAGFTFSIVGVLYSVILGFTVVNVQARYNTAVDTIHLESNLIADLYRDAGYFPEPGRSSVRKSLREYVDYILEVEWGILLGKSKRVESEQVLGKIWDSYYNVDVTDDKTKVWYEQSVSRLDDLLNARLSREFSAREHLGSMMWSLLLVGAIITVGFMFFFGLEDLKSHMMMMALLAGYLSFMLYLVYSLDNLFKGPEAIKPVALEQVVELFSRWN